MLKIHKGLKKKKKDKKNKHKEDDLFDQEELQKYRQQHANDQSTAGEQSDEWQKFKALTAGVDTILQKTQQDLDRIKSTSFFQRKAAPSEVTPSDPPDQPPTPESPEPEPEPKSDSEQSEPPDDTLFDTSYVDAVASGELKLAYIPDSPDKQDDYDPFDTSYADKFVESNPKKRYLNLGCAVQVLSGKAAPTSEIKSPRRRVKPLDLLSSFDSATETLQKTSLDSSPPVKTLLDEDPLFDAPVIVDVLEKQPSTEADDEFAQLARRSSNLAVTPIESDPFDTSIVAQLIQPGKQEIKQLERELLGDVIIDDDFNPRAADTDEPDLLKIQPRDSPITKPLTPAVDSPRPCYDDPFDTSHVSGAPGALELKLIERELTADDDFDPRKYETDTVARTILEKYVEPSSSDLTPQLDILTGTEVIDIAHTPVQPRKYSEDEFSYADPFDTSIADNIGPGKTELKLLETELITET